MLICFSTLWIMVDVVNEEKDEMNNRLEYWSRKLMYINFLVSGSLCYFETLASSTCDRNRDFYDDFQIQYYLSRAS